MGKHAVLFVSPTGSGKTCIFSYISQGASAKNNRTLILSHRQEIIRQICQELTAFDVPHGIIRAGIPQNLDRMTQVASVQTLARRSIDIPKPDLIIVDEAHHATSAVYTDIFQCWPDVPRIGFTATPQRLDGRGLGDVFDHIVLGPSVDHLIGSGFLSKPVYYAPPSGADPSKLRIMGGDFRRDESEAMMDRPNITGSAVEHYRKICDGVPAIAFCTSIKHAENVTRQFNEAGYRAAMIDGKMNDYLRMQRTQWLGDGRLQILVSVDVISEGYNVPVVTAAIMLRPTASLGLHLQQVGRVLRPHPGKTRAIILDHCGNCLRHGLAEEPREWSLESKRKRRSSSAVMKNRQCPACYAVHSPSPQCPQCGHTYPVKPRSVEEQAGELTELTPEKIQAFKRDRRVEIGMARTRDALQQIARKRGYSSGWVWNMMKIKRIPFAPKPNTPIPA